MSEIDRIFREDWRAGNGWFIPAGSISEVAAASLDRLIDRAKHGGSADIILRVDARQTRWQADWIKYMCRVGNP